MNITQQFLSTLLVSYLSLVTLAAGADSAQSVMDKAHHGRATWQKPFPGFTANLTAASAGRAATGTFKVGADGKLEIKLAEPQGLEWVERSLNSLIGHRLADDQGAENVEFADDDTKHPLGRLLKSKDADEKSLWRVQGDVLTEVHRFHGENHMVISVGEVARTPEGKHLPKSFSVTTWNDKSGAIVSTRQVLQEWKRIDGVDLPVKIIAATNKNDGSRVVEEITFAKHQLLKADMSNVSITELPAIKIGVTSAGAAVAAGNLYLYGGHTGPAHNYSADMQSGSLLRLNLAKPEAWEEVAQGPKRTGLALVAYKGQVYRIGGWESKNDKGEKWLLYSSKDFSRFDPATGKWTELTPMPRGRSSHDAALVGDHLYVAGGWELNGEGDGDWHTTALVCDLSQDKLTWKEIAKPEFMRRALAVAGYQGKLYVLGGMTSDNEVTTAVSIYDPKADRWTTGPNLPGSGMAAFGPSAFGGNDGLFCTVQDGSLLRLSNDGKSWEKVAALKHPRFFHRLVIGDDQQLLVVAGTNRGGKVTVTESIRLTGNAPRNPK
jgi:N-acetylneuraminic acid mutarotase